MTDADTDKGETCYYCEGNGTVECSTCSGRGGRNAHSHKPVGFDYRKVEGGFEWVTCTECDGTGRVECPECHGGDLP